MIRNHTHASNSMGRQSGVALVIALVFLVVLTLLGVTAMQTATLQERMAGHDRDRGVAFQSSEAALREGEDLLALATVPPFDGTNGLYQAADGADTAVWDDIDWSDAGAVRILDLGGEGSSGARYIVEEMPADPLAEGTLAADVPVPTTGSYRVTARSFGQSGTADVMIQSTFRRQ